jgi:phosphoribosylcarboxyaminoimidazole (NCAIR) mutase
MYQSTFDSQFKIPAVTASRKTDTLLEKIRDRLKQAMKFRTAGVGKQAHPQTFIEAHLLDDVMGPEIKRTLRI